MVDPVDKLGQALAALRAQRVAAQRGEHRRRQSAPTTRKADVATLARTETLKAAVAQAVVALDPAAADWRQRARRVFVEQVLQQEFGREVALDPAFAGLVRGVVSDLCDDDASARQLDTQLASLLRSKTSGRSLK
jgi:hypothetical protein